MSDNPAVATPVDNSPWISKITDAELIGAAQTKGWDKLDPVEAFQQAAKAHRSAEKMLGAPSDHLLRIPTRDDDEAGWRNVWNRLGAPEKPEGYSFDGLELPDPDNTKRFQDTIRQTAAELNMPKAMAERLAATFHKFIDDSGKAVQAEQTAQLQVEQQRLSQDWGQPNSDRWRANMFVADQAAEKLGVPPETLSRLKEGMGAADVARMFHKIGVALGEDRFVAGSNPVNNGVMGREQAVARRGELMADTQWRDRYLNGGKPELREMTALNTLISGGP